jgi:hypothetical protein
MNWDPLTDDDEGILSIYYPGCYESAPWDERDEYVWNDVEIANEHSNKAPYVLEFETRIIAKGPPKFAAVIPIEVDLDGDVINEKIQWFDSEKDANAALANAPKPKIGAREEPYDPGWDKAYPPDDYDPQHA